MEQRFIVQDLVARFLVRKQLHQASASSDFPAEHVQDKIHVLGRELDPAVWLNQYSSLSRRSIDSSTERGRAAFRLARTEPVST